MCVLSSQWLFGQSYSCMTRDSQEEGKDMNDQETQCIDILNFI